MNNHFVTGSRLYSRIDNQWDVEVLEDPSSSTSEFQDSIAEGATQHDFDHEGLSLPVENPSTGTSFALSYVHILCCLTIKNKFEYFFTMMLSSGSSGEDHALRRDFLCS